MDEVNSLKVGKLAKWHAAPKQPGRWGLLDEDKPDEILADVYPCLLDGRTMARVWKWPGTQSRLYDIEAAKGGMTTLEARTWVEKYLGLPVCEDA
jgi:hypothetical protein